MGIPYMIMELALGQKFQRGDIAVFRGINKNLAGIGVISVYSSYIFSFYYNVIVAWAAVYVVVAFFVPLPWSADVKDKVWTCHEGDVSRAEQFFKVNVIRLVDENCKEFEDGDVTTFSGTAFGATLAVWVIIFLCVFKGVGSSSYIVWATVPLPVLFVIIMIINGNLQDGAPDGIKKYFSGKEGAEATSAAS
jgi:SNF family Na+-dependent transporter